MVDGAFAKSVLANDEGFQPEFNGENKTHLEIRCDSLDAFRHEGVDHRAVQQSTDDATMHLPWKALVKPTAGKRRLYLVLIRPGEGEFQSEGIFRGTHETVRMLLLAGYL